MGGRGGRLSGVPVVASPPLDLIGVLLVPQMKCQRPGHDSKGADLGELGVGVPHLWVRVFWGAGDMGPHTESLRFL